MESLKRITLVLACICMLALLYRLVKSDTPRPVAAAVPVPADTPAPTATPIPDPVWEWTSVKKESFVVAPGAGLTGYGVPQNSSVQRKIIVEAKLPIFAAYFPQSANQTVISNPTEALKYPLWHCINQHVLNTTIECPLDTSTEGYLLLLKDERTAAQALSAGLLGGFGVKKPLEDATARNDVSIEILEYRCVRNCTEYDKNR